jgi:hypothetical protein
VTPPPIEVSRGGTGGGATSVATGRRAVGSAGGDDASGGGGATDNVAIEGGCHMGERRRQLGHPVAHSCVRADTR